MATFLILGTYTNKGAKGLVEKNSDRREAMKTLASSVGAKFIDYSITRGIYDFWILVEADNYDKIAAINLKAKSADTIDKVDVLETIDINKIRQEANDVNYIPPTEWISIPNELFLRKFKFIKILLWNDRVSRL